jgi:ribosome-associated protein
VTPDADEAVERALASATESFIAASGPGGQNVNKVATAVQLRLDIYALRLAPAVCQRLSQSAGSRITPNGQLLPTAPRSRTHHSYRADARDRLEALIRAAHDLPQKRAKSRLNRVGKEKRLQVKKQRGAVKAGRGRVRPE